jgi:hypothetical protein
LDFGSVKFGEAINRFLEQFRMLMLEPVIFLVCARILQPEIRRQIHNLEAALQQVRDYLDGFPVGQSCENDIAVSSDSFDFGLLESEGG